MYVFDGSITSVTIFGASIFSVLFNMAGSNLRHSGVWLGYGNIEKYIVSPAQHQIHHSIEERHFDKNFGSTLAIWDRFFNSWVGSKHEAVSSFGLLQKSIQQKLTRQLFGI
ncbi:MAG: sterol desaturase family protein [Agarilytica sp.]